jgi:hypothetical protein
MKKAFLASMLLLAFGAGPLSAQAGQAAQAGSGSNPLAGPGEPEMVMPQVILQIEDLSVEKVEAQLPPEEELLPPERSIPVLSEGDLAVGEPQIPVASVDSEGAALQGGERFLSSEVELGAGTPNQILGSMSLKTLGQDPRFTLQFHHETLDGFWGYQPGSGFSLRDDSLDGGLKFRIGSVDTDLSGSFLEKETGLQGPASPYVAALSRRIGATAAFAASPQDWLTLNAGLAGGFDSLTLEGAAPLSVTGLHVEPSLSGEARFGGVKIGLDTSYAYREGTLGIADALHRYAANASIGVTLPVPYTFTATGGWFWNSAGLSLFPFSLSATGTPVDFLTVSLDGGYKVIPYDVRDIIGSHALAYPTALEDDRGWFTDASVQLTLMRDLAVTAKLSFMASDRMPVGSLGKSGKTGLFDVTQTANAGQQPYIQLSSDAGLRWGISQSFSVSAGWTHQFFRAPFFTPSDLVTAEILGLETNGRFGGSLSFAMSPTAAGVLQQPVIRVSGFWKISDAVKLQIDGDDLLSPLIPGGRVDLAPYVTPGFRVTGSLGVSL